MVKEKVPAKEKESGNKNSNHINLEKRIGKTRNLTSYVNNLINTRDKKNDPEAFDKRYILNQNQMHEEYVGWASTIHGEVEVREYEERMNNKKLREGYQFLIENNYLSSKKSSWVKNKSELADKMLNYISNKELNLINSKYNSPENGKTNEPSYMPFFGQINYLLGSDKAYDRFKAVVSNKVGNYRLEDARNIAKLVDSLPEVSWTSPGDITLEDRLWRTQKLAEFMSKRDFNHKFYNAARNNLKYQVDELSKKQIKKVLSKSAPKKVGDLDVRGIVDSYQSSLGKKIENFSNDYSGAFVDFSGNNSGRNIEFSGKYAGLGVSFSEGGPKYVEFSGENSGWSSAFLDCDLMGGPEFYGKNSGKNSGMTRLSASKIYTSEQNTNRKFKWLKFRNLDERKRTESIY